MANILFLVIDMQNGFINNFTEDLVPKILDFQAKIRDSVLTAGTRYVNHEHTACYMFEGWKNCMAGTKEAEIAPALRGCMARVFDKDKYSCWNEEMKAEEGNAIHTFRRNGITVKFHSKTGRRICMFPGNLTSTERKTWRGLPAKKGSYCG